jgi:hypothetical protein
MFLGLLELFKVMGKSCPSLLKTFHITLYPLAIHLK